MKFMNRYRDIKLRYKLLIIYIVVSAIPLAVIGFFSFSKLHTILVSKEESKQADFVKQAAINVENQMKIYDNLSNYIAYNQTISQIVSYDYKNTYQMYQKFNGEFDSLLASLKYFHEDVKQVTIYSRDDIVKHNNTLAPLSEIASEKWVNELKGTNEIKWFADYNNKKIFSARYMPLLKASGTDGILYIELKYDKLFEGLNTMNGGNYGMYVVDNQGNTVYSYNGFETKYTNYSLTKEECVATEKKQKSEYTFVKYKMDSGDFTIYMYRPSSLTLSQIRSTILMSGLIFIVCVVLSLIAVTIISRFTVVDIEKLTANMKKVEQGDIQITVHSDSKDEVGNLIRGFENMLDEINVLIKENYESKISQKEYEMKTLQAQINPHFLYNSLSLINWKAIEAEQEDISRLTLLLSTFYRTALNRGKNTLTIEDEIKNMQSYLEIQLMMHDYEFDANIEVEEGLEKYYTLNLLLQPLIENAIDHGIDLKEDGERGRIDVKVESVGDHIQMMVKDNGVGMDLETAQSIISHNSKGYGVKNVHDRIRIYYGEEYSLHIDSEIGRGTTAYIEIPKSK